MILNFSKSLIYQTRNNILVILETVEHVSLSLIIKLMAHIGLLL